MPAAATRPQLIAALEWWIAAGVDAPVREVPVPWTRAFPAPAAHAPADVAPPPMPISAVPGEAAIAAAPDLAALRALASARFATPVIFADGNPDTAAMIVGEGPAADDLATGRVFSGPAGALLDRMLAAIALSRESAYLINVALTRNPAGRPDEADIAAGLPFARRHIQLVKPRAVLLMGGIPANALGRDPAPISRLRGTWLDLDGVPALATFNPAYLLRRPQDKRLAWADLLAFKANLG